MSRTWSDDLQSSSCLDCSWWIRSNTLEHPRISGQEAQDPQIVSIHDLHIVIRGNDVTILQPLNTGHWFAIDLTNKLKFVLLLCLFIWRSLTEPGRYLNLQGGGRIQWVLTVDRSTLILARVWFLDRIDLQRSGADYSKPWIQVAVKRENKDQ